MGRPAHWRTHENRSPSQLGVLRSARKGPAPRSGVTRVPGLRMSEQENINCFPDGVKLPVKCLKTKDYVQRGKIERGKAASGVGKELERKKKKYRLK